MDIEFTHSINVEIQNVLQILKMFPKVPYQFIMWMLSWNNSRQMLPCLSWSEAENNCFSLFSWEYYILCTELMNDNSVQFI